MKETISTFLILLASWLGVYNPQPLGDFDALPPLVSTSTPFSAYTTRSGKSLYLPSRTVTATRISILGTLNCNGTSVLETDATGNVQCGADGGGAGGGNTASLSGTSTSPFKQVYFSDDLHSASTSPYFTFNTTNLSLSVSGTGASVTGTGASYLFTSRSTTDLSEGANLYYTDARVDANINASTTIAMGDPVDDTAFIGNGSAWQIKAVPNCVDSGGQHLNYTAASNAFSCGTTGDGAGGGSSNWSFFNLLTISPTSTVGITIQTVATTTNLTVTSISGIVKCNGEAQCAAGVADTDYQQAITFTANDFDYSAPTLSIDYANGQAASASADGFLQSADFINFNISTTSTLNATSTLLKAAWLDDNILIGSGSAWELKSIPNCTDASGNHLNYTAASNAFSCGTTASYGDTNVATYINASTTMPIIPAGGLTGVTLLSGGRALSATTVLDVIHGGTGAGLFTAGSIVFAGASGVYTQDNANFYWDDTNNRFGIASSIPAFALSMNDATQGAFWVDTLGTGNVFEVQNATSNILFSVATSTGNMTFHGHITASAVPLLTAPVVSACGTGTPTVVGNDSAGAVTVGGGVQASCVLTFQKSWTIAPSCFANDSSALQAVKASATVSALTLSVATTFAGEVVNYFCIGY